MGNHCVEHHCYECGYYECMRCNDSGVSYIPSGGLKRYLQAKAEGKLGNYRKCHNCGAKALG